MKRHHSKKQRETRYVRLPLKVLKFLLGVAPLEGVWFGEMHPKKPGRFWWRSAYLKKHYGRINAVQDDAGWREHGKSK